MKASQKYQLDKIICGTWQSEWPALTLGDILARAPCTKKQGAGHGREDSEGLGGAHEVIYSQTTAEL